MTSLKQLQAHKGGLIRLKTQLFWYDGRGYDNNPGRICLLLDSDATRTAATVAAAAAAVTGTTAATAVAAAFLLIDGQPQWVCVAEQDIELLVNDQPIS